MTLLLVKLRIAWLINELLIQYLRARLNWELSGDVDNGAAIQRICDAMLAARERRPKWLSEWLDRRGEAPWGRQ